jgi:ribosomal protein L37E
VEVEIKPYKTDDDSDSITIDYLVDGKIMGNGYQGKDDKRFYIIRCPRCRRENWGIAVATGMCCWCGLDANAL